MNKELIIQVHPVIDYKMRKLCVQPYYNHPKGCPNFNKKEGCPPQAEFFDKTYDLIQPIYAICNIFDYKTHIEKMRKKQPNWSERQIHCVLYWQNGARSHLSKHIVNFLREHNGEGYRIAKCPEAMGVNLTETMKNAGIVLEWMPVNVAYQIVLASKKL